MSRIRTDLPVAPLSVCRTLWRLLALVAALLFMADPRATQAGMVNPTGGNIADLALHNVDATTLDPKPPVQRTLNGGANDVWTLTVTNTGKAPWTDFHVEVRPNNLLAGNLDLGPVSATGFSVQSPTNFNKIQPGQGVFGNKTSTADRTPDPIVGIVPGGGKGSLTLSITVTNKGLNQNDYYLGVQPTASPFPAPAGGMGGAGMKNKGKSDGSSIIYDASLQSLSFTGHHMADTGFPGDPILAANVNIPSFTLAGQLSDGAFLFQVASGQLFSISSGSTLFMQAEIPFLTYLPDSNSFYGQMTSFSFPGVQSPWIAEMASLLNPSSPNFDPSLQLWFTYQPKDNLASLTQGFSQSAVSDGTDAIFAAPVAVPEPNSFVLLALGISAVGLWGRCWGIRGPAACEHSAGV